MSEQLTVHELLERERARMRRDAMAELATDYARKDYYVALFVPDERYHPVLACAVARFDVARMKPWYGLVHCERFERGTKLETMAARAAALWDHGPLQRAYCVQMLVETSHGGMPLEEAIRGRGIPASFWQVGVGETNGNMRVLSLTDLRATARTLGEENRMRVRNNLPDLPQYLDEIRKLRLGADVGEWQKQSRAVTAALACWLGEWYRFAAWSHAARACGGQVQ